MIGRRMVAAGVVVAAVTAGGVAGAVIGIPGLSGASSSPSLSTTAQSSTGTAAGGPHFHGRRVRPGLGAGQDVLDAAAKALNLSTAGSPPEVERRQDDDRRRRRGSRSVAVQTVIDAMEAVANSRHLEHREQPVPGVRPVHAGHRRRPSGARARRIRRPAVRRRVASASGSAATLGGSIDAVAKALGISTQDLLE